ncbi:hypothetical protein HZ994_04370 [Akkermansiaceae bacterium]|nr:hypothetical protein HZ994_04370 [Akkermansiaceae bacterium]
MKITMSWARTAAMVAGMLVSVGDEGLAGEFIRVKETDDSAKLQTAVFGYEKDGGHVDLIGAIHIADKGYYQFLNKRFEGYGVLLFEMVGGERLGGGKNKREADKQEGENKLAGLRTLYESMEKALGLTGQGSQIDYFAENFVHADLTMEEFEALQKERGESILGFMIQAGMNAEKPTKDPDAMRLMRGILTGRPDLVKLEVMHTMAQGGEQIDAMAGENVIITDRNAKCMEVLDREIAKGGKKIGIFYGAAHFPDMEKRLLERGFVRVKTQWLTAWKVAKG